MTSEHFFYCCNRSKKKFFSGHVLCQFFYGNFPFRRGRGGGLKLGLYVFQHNNNFNFINIYSAKTITIEYKKITDLFTV